MCTGGIESQWLGAVAEHKPSEHYSLIEGTMLFSIPAEAGPSHRYPVTCPSLLQLPFRVAVAGWVGGATKILTLHLPLSIQPDAMRV